MTITGAVNEPSDGNSFAKIRLKGGPKRYKSGPGPTGRERLQRRVNSLLLGANRLARTTSGPDERHWAERLVRTLQAFNTAGDV